MKCVRLEKYGFGFLYSDGSVPGQADTLLQKRFHDLSQSTDAFSSVQYVGTQTITPPTDYSQLQQIVNQQVKNTSQRAPRQPAIVFSALQVQQLLKHFFVYVCVKRP